MSSPSGSTIARVTVARFSASGVIEPSREKLRSAKLQNRVPLAQGAMAERNRSRQPFSSAAGAGAPGTPAP
jgi:hypothetical protein